jgi:hypothetical protein
VLSALAGLAVLLNLTGLLARNDLALNIYKGSVRLFSLSQIIFFVLSLLLALWFGLTWEEPSKGATSVITH